MGRLKIITFLFLIVSVFACDNDEPTPQTNSRTVLVYLAANNSLSGYADSNIENMMQGAANGNLNGGNFLIYLAPRNGVPQLLRIRQDADGQIVKETIKTYPKQNSVSIDVMRNVITEVITDFPATSYGLVLWSHGTGWLPSNVLSDDMLRSFGQDGQNWMELNELAQALPDHQFNYILFDACYMGSVEVAYALRAKTEYILASPTEIMADGMPYQLIVKDMFAETPGLKQIAEKFYQFYDQKSGKGRSASISLINTAHMNELAALTREIVQSNKEAINTLPLNVIQPLDYLGGTRYHAFYDYDDYITRLATAEQAARFTKCLGDVIVYKATTPKAYYSYGGNGLIVSINHFSGLSAYIPQVNLTKLNSWYESLDWYKAVYK
ncbi:MAG: clostripain-related cysteine peptidase [Tannerellaceae bacterium]